MKTKVVVSGSTVTAGQLKDLFRMVADGTIGFDHLDGFLQNPHRFVENRVTLARALNILGEQKVLTVEQAAKARKLSASQNVAIRYSEATLRECSDQNKRADTDWRLVYVFGLSLRELRDQVGTNPNLQPCVYKNDWWLEKQEDGWANEKPESGYYLIDFNGRWGSTSWNNQEENIQKLGSDYERTHETVISEATFSIYQTTKERLLETWYHWGKNLDSYGDRVLVGGFDRDGLSVDVCHPAWLGVGWMRVCVSRKFQS